MAPSPSRTFPQLREKTASARAPKPAREARAPDERDSRHYSALRVAPRRTARARNPRRGARFELSASRRANADLRRWNNGWLAERRVSWRRKCLAGRRGGVRMTARLF